MASGQFNVFIATNWQHLHLARNAQLPRPKCVASSGSDSECFQGRRYFDGMDAFSKHLLKRE
jgi:hypothetical protein